MFDRSGERQQVNHETTQSGGRPMLVTTDEAARLLAVSVRTLANLETRRELPAVRIGRAKRYRLSDIEAFIERKAVASGVGVE